MKKYSLIVASLLLSLCIFIPKATAAEGVSMPAVTSNLQYGELITLMKDDPAQTNALVSKKGVIDLLTGNYVKEFSYDYDDIAVNDDATFYVVQDNYRLEIYNQFGELKSVMTKFGDPYDYQLDEFIPKTNLLLISSTTELIAYDVEKQKVIFTRNLNQRDIVHATSQYIAVNSGNTINLYDLSGTYLDTLELDSEINDFIFSADGQQLVVSTNAPQLTIFRVNRNFERIVLNDAQFYPGNTSMEQIKVDENGKYLIGTSEEAGFRIFNFITGERIHTEIDGNSPYYYWNNPSIAITPNGKYILVDDKLYNGKNLTKYVTSISIPTEYQTIELGSKIQPTVQVTQADGSTGNITAGVTWLLSNTNVAYINNTTNTLMTKKTGTVDLKASYLSFEETMKVTVVDTKSPKLSGIVNKTIYTGSSFNPKTGITATDVGEGNLTKQDCSFWESRYKEGWNI